MAEYTAAKYAVVCVNGINALHIALKLSGVEEGDMVITQPLTFIATTNAIVYAGAVPAFVDVDKDTMGLSPTSLERFLQDNAQLRNGACYHKQIGRRIKACLPMFVNCERGDLSNAEWLEARVVNIPSGVRK